ncbi:MAG: Transcription initiation factor TFIID subunit 9 [Chrysothrix sp. TS-e1954]|nr:MAG: Transcription initiation factor TFIID subunit 9 [Chrysothrix sp. TS-e1954]
MDQANGSTSTTQPAQPASQPPRSSEPLTTDIATTLDTNPSVPRTSLTDSGDSPRPRDARTIHLILSSLGVNAYQERVPLQLLDFAYRYTTGVLSDAYHLAAEGYVNHPGKDASSGGKAQKDGDVSVAALRLASQARLGYQFNAASLPKETLLEMAAERNRVKLPAVDKDVRFGVRLPHERFVMTGQGWQVPEEWEEDEVEVEEEDGREPDTTMGLDGTDERDEEAASPMKLEGEDNEMGEDDHVDQGIGEEAGDGTIDVVKEEDARMSDG